MDYPTLTVLRKRAVTLEGSIAIYLRVLGRQADSARMIQVIQLCESELRRARRGEKAMVAKYDQLEEAKASGDFVTALILGDVPKHLRAKGTKVLQGLRKKILEHKGLTMILQDLEEGVLAAAEGQPLDMMYAVYVLTEETMDKPLTYEEQMRYPSLYWQEQNAALYNRVLWEVCKEYGFKRLRAALYRDLRSEDQYFKDHEGNPILSDPSGKVWSKKTAQLLLDEFMKNNPNPDLVLMEV